MSEEKIEGKIKDNIKDKDNGRGKKRKSKNIKFVFALVSLLARIERRTEEEK